MSLTIQSGGSVTIQGGSGGGGGGATVGTFANRPAAGNAGAIYIATDSPIAQWVDDGSAWRPLIQGQALGTQVPAASAFTPVNSGVFSNASGAIAMTRAAGAGNFSLRGGAVSLSSSTAYVQGVFAGPYAMGGRSALLIGLRESSSGKSVCFALTSFDDFINGPIASVQTYGGDIRTGQSGINAIPFNMPVAGRVRRLNSSVYVDMSPDLQNWQNVGSVALSSFTSSPDQAMFGIMSESSSVATGMLLSFQYGSL